jgi:hypothetical protein
LHRPGQRLAARHNRVGRVVRPPLPQQPTTSQAGAPPRVEWPAVALEEDLATGFVGEPRIELRAQLLCIGRVRPLLTDVELAPIVEDRLGSELGTGQIIAVPRDRPRDPLVLHLLAFASVFWVLLAARLYVRQCLKQPVDSSCTGADAGAGRDGWSRGRLKLDCGSARVSMPWRRALTWWCRLAL